MISIYLDKLLYSPLDFPSFRKKTEQQKIQIKKSPQLANIILSSYLHILEKYALKYGKKKKYLLWTHEPYHNFTQKKIHKINGISIHIMNVYTGDVFLDNFRYFYFHTPLDEEKIGNPGDPGYPPIVALSTFYDKSYYSKNPRTTLPLRYSLIERGYQRGLLDVHGKGWEKNSVVSVIGNSRNLGDRREGKAEVLRHYRFSLCLENTDTPYYVTEKIWEPIKYGCLPIYNSNSTIYEIFPKNSFLDARDFENADALYDYLETMSEKEYKDRYSRCVEAFNQVIAEGKNTTWRGKSKNLNINYLEYHSCYKELIKKLKSL